MIDIYKKISSNLSKEYSKIGMRVLDAIPVLSDKIVREDYFNTMGLSSK